MLEARDAIIAIRTGSYHRQKKGARDKLWDDLSKIAFPKFTDAPKEEASIDSILRQLTGGKLGK